MILAIFNLVRLLLLFICALFFAVFSKKNALYWFFYHAGPSFIKLGQVLSVRSDLVGEDIASQLSNFQDKTAPSSPKKINKILNIAFANNMQATFLQFDYQPVACASIAQVHKAVLHNGKTVAVKILHPNIVNIFRRDIATITFLAKILAPVAKFVSRACFDVADLLTNVAKFELDLLHEAANASQLKENLRKTTGLYVPDIFWQHSSRQVLVMEWLQGIPFSDKRAIADSKIDKKIVAQNLVIGYFQQVYEDGFFHADMHPGNLFLLENGNIGIVDFGIMGKIDKKTRLVVAKILIAFLHKDYNKVAQLHIEGGFVPQDINLYDLALSCRKIGEMIVDIDVKSISLAALLTALIDMTKNYQMQTKPELLLLQKTLLLVEGVGVALDVNLNIWDLARPWVKQWAKLNIGFDARIVNAISDIITFCKQKFSS